MTPRTTLIVNDWILTDVSLADVEVFRSTGDKERQTSRQKIAPQTLKNVMPYANVLYAVDNAVVPAYGYYGDFPTEIRKHFDNVITLNADIIKNINDKQAQELFQTLQHGVDGY
jgi:RNA binding exosome subunit